MIRSLLVLVLFAPLSRAAEAEKVSYYKEIRPIFQQTCQGCHQPAKMGGGYNMTNFADLFKKGDREKLGIVAGKPEASFLVDLIQPKKGKPAEMPRGKESLPEAQIKKIITWIQQGASDDTPASASAKLIDAEHPPVYELPPVVNSVAFSPDGQFLAVSGYHEILLLTADGSELVARLVGLSERLQSISFSPDGRFLAAAGGTPALFGEVQIWDAQKRKLVHSHLSTYDTLYGVSWSPDGGKVAFGCADNTIRAIDSTSGQQVLFQGAHSDWVMGTVFSQDGQHLVSVSRDRSVKLTEVPTQRFVDNVTSITPGALKGGLLAVDRRPVKDPKVQQAAELAKAFNGFRFPNLVALKKALTPPPPRYAVMPKDVTGVPLKVYDEILVAGADGQPHLYKMHREVKRVIGDDANKIRDYAPLPGRVYCAVFSKDGKYFAAGSSLDGAGEARVYEVDSARQVAKFDGVKTPVYSIAFRPDGKVAASAGFDGMVRLNDPITGKLIKEFMPFPMKK
jgi:WD40 repeat protein